MQFSVQALMNAGTAAYLSCAAHSIEVIEGPIDATFRADDGTTATATREPAVARILDNNTTELKSVIYVRGEGEEKEVLTRSDAILAILDDLGGFWRLLGFARFAPRALRDRLYDWIARGRYRWFGRLEVCQLPGEGQENLFLG